MKPADHQRNMKRFGKRYNAAKSETLEKTGRLSNRAKRGLIIGAVAFCIIALFILALCWDSIGNAMRNSEIKRHKAEIAAQIETYAEQGDYEELEKYCESYDILEKTGPLSDYFPVTWSANYYNYVEFYIGFFNPHGDPQMDALEDIGDYVAEFFYVSYLDQYTDIEGAVNDRNAQLIKQMQERMCSRLQECFYLTDEDLEEIAGMSSSKITDLLEKRYLEHAQTDKKS